MIKRRVRRKHISCPNLAWDIAQVYWPACSNTSFYCVVLTCSRIVDLIPAIRLQKRPGFFFPTPVIQKWLIYRLCWLSWMCFISSTSHSRIRHRIFCIPWPLAKMKRLQILQILPLTHVLQWNKRSFVAHKSGRFQLEERRSISLPSFYQLPTPVLRWL